MISVDTNLLMYAYNQASPHHTAAYAWMSSLLNEENVAISELVLAELYGLLRNPSALKAPLSADEAVEVIQTYRSHPRWRLIGFPLESRPLHDALWQLARRKDFAFRRFYDARTALTMTAQGVTDFATVNVKDFEGLGFQRVWNPLVSVAK